MEIRIYFGNGIEKKQQVLLIDNSPITIIQRKLNENNADNNALKFIAKKAIEAAEKFIKDERRPMEVNINVNVPDQTPFDGPGGFVTKSEIYNWAKSINSHLEEWWNNERKNGSAI